jgi:acyl carrier protein
MTREGVEMYTREQIRNTLIEIIENDMGENFDHVEDDTKLREQLGLDSVDVVSIVSQVERRFRIRLSHQELETLVSVGDVLTLLEQKLSGDQAQTAAA